MSVEDNIRNIHKEIQQNISIMIPEKYKKICLYASVINGRDGVSTGEMFFYYFPSGILKKNPINVYEIAELFNVEEEQYRKLENRLYRSIRKLRHYCIKIGQKPWTNITITIEGTKYKVEYNYDNLITSEFNNYDRHVIWRYKNLKVPIESYGKKERDVIKRYFESEEYLKSNTEIYEENIYEKHNSNIMGYESVISHEESITAKVNKKETENGKKNQLLNF